MKKLDYIKGHYQTDGVGGVMRLFATHFHNKLSPILNRGGNKVECPCCGWKGNYFEAYIAGGAITKNAACPNCRSHGRHRGHLLYYQDLLRLQTRNGKLLFFAPERAIIPFLDECKYLQVETSGYEDNKMDYQFDIMHIDAPDNTWDYILCHRVIEHVPDDRKALCELYRVLKPGGTAIVSVPIYREKTIDYGAPDPLEDYHYYAYGHDFLDRFPQEFSITRHVFSKMFTSEQFKRHSFMEDYIFEARKPPLT